MNLETIIYSFKFCVKLLKSHSCKYDIYQGCM